MGQLLIPILYALLLLFFIIGITLLLYKYFPDALCVLFILNLFFSLYTMTFIPDLNEINNKKK